MQDCGTWCKMGSVQNTWTSTHCIFPNTEYVDNTEWNM